MTESNNFKIGKISEDFHMIIEKIKNILELNDKKSLDIFEQKLKEIENNKILKVAFVGQYSAGKSTIISALTGNKSIKIDADIATDHTDDYKWNDIILTDTPGLYTDRPDHDQITNDKIKESDLLIYCLTSDLFDNIILENFRKLAFNDGYKNKMMIVINKMSMESGKYIDLVNNYKISLRKSLSPYNFDEFMSSFIDAADYIEGVNENENSLIEISHFNDFLKNLNSFVSSKGIIGKLDTPFRIALTTIDNIIINISSKDDKELFQTIERIEYAINKNKERTESYVKSKINELSLTIIRKSNELTSKIGEKDINLDEESKTVNIYIEKEIETVRDEIQNIIEQQNIVMEEQISNILKSDLAKYVFNSIDTGKIKLTSSVKNDFKDIIKNFEKVKGGGSIVSQTVGKLTGTSAIDGMAKASQVAGSQAVGIIKEVGHFFGAKFKPWQAVNIAKNVGNALKFLGPALSIIGLFLEVGDAVKEEDNAKKIADAKRQCYNQFLSITSEIENEFIKNFEEFKKNSFIKILEQIRSMRNSILSERKQNDKISKELLLQKSKLEQLLNNIYK